MGKPTITPAYNGYVFSWPDEKLEISVSRVKIHTDGRIVGEILITSSIVANRPIYPQTAINFVAERTRTALIKTLAETYPKWDWAGIINQLCLCVVDRSRQGEPVQELWTYDNIPDIEYLLEPILIKGVPTVIYGEKGVAKSTLALVFYICLTLPWIDNPLGLIAPTRSVKTLILDYELPGYIALRNAKHFQEGMGLPTFSLHHRRCITPLADDIEQIANHINNLKAEVIIIDSLARASGGDLNKTDGANAFFESLDKLHGVTSLIIAQTSKDQETKRKTIYGNALFTYYARSIFELCKSEYVDDDEIDVALFHRFSNLTKIHPSMSFKICYNGHKSTIERQPINVAEFVAKVNVQAAILDSLRSGALSAKDIAEHIQSSPGIVSATLTRLKKKGTVINLEHGQWGLVSKTPSV